MADPSPMDQKPNNNDDDQIKSADLRKLGEEGGPVGLRQGRDPSNLGDEVPEESDLTIPNAEPLPEPAQM